MKTPRRVAVLGAGTMGSRIAAHFANAGVPSLLLDVITPDDRDRNAAAVRGLEAALRQKPPAFFTEAGRDLVATGNFEDHLPMLAECDWIVEAVVENLAVKRELWKKAEICARPDAILSTNTSGISLARLSEVFPPASRRRFLGTHFFNPPRYLHLLEVIPGAETDPALVGFVSEFADRRLGKGVVVAKDTPNFIANRLGGFLSATVMKTMVEGDYSVEEVDALTGPLIGLPSSASFRLLDIVGLDVWASVARNVYEGATADPWRGRYLLPTFFDEMIERGWLGEKSGQGFYRRIGGRIEVIDWRTLEYHAPRPVRLTSVEAARGVEDLAARLRMLVESKDRAGAFLWAVLSDYLLYAAGKVPEIADRAADIDRAMRWGYAHKLGPFELWEALGFEATALRLEREGRALPEGARGALDSDEWRRPERRPGVLVLSDIKRSAGVLRTNEGATLVDLGDGVLGLAWSCRMDGLGRNWLAMIQAAIEEAERNFDCLVIAGQGDNFSTGASLEAVLLAAEAGEWDEIDDAVRRFEQANLALKYASIPVVAAPYGRTLGAGCALVLHCGRVQAGAELYLGFNETSAGLIPAGGGVKELLARRSDPKRAFDLIAGAIVSSSAENARELGLLAPTDGLSMNPERLLADAKAAALALAGGFVPRAPGKGVKTPGEAGYAALKLWAWTAHQAGWISAYDLAVAEKLAYVLSGGRVAGEQPVSEQRLLDLEREAFLSLCGNRETRARIDHLLNTGKPLRN